MLGKIYYFKVDGYEYIGKEVSNRLSSSLSKDKDGWDVRTFKLLMWRPPAYTKWNKYESLYTVFLGDMSVTPKEIVETGITREDDTLPIEYKWADKK